MQPLRRILILSLCAAVFILPTHADSHVSLNFFGLKFERHTRTSPTLKLVIETNEPNLSGQWMAELAGRKPGRNTQIWIPVIIKQGNSEHHIGQMGGSSGKFAFLFSEKKSWPGQTAIEAPAGSLLLTGKISGNDLAGTFTFSPDANYVAQATKQLQSEPSLIDLLSLALHEVTLEDIDAYVRSGLQLRAAGVISLKNAGVSAEYCAAVRKARPFTADEIVRLRHAGVDAQFPAELQSAGYNFDAEQIVRLRNAGVSSEFAREWKQAGFDYNADALVRMRNAGVPPDLAKAVHGAFPNAQGEQVVRLRNAGISEDFVAEMHRANKMLTIDDLVRLRNAGVSPDYVKAWGDAGYSYKADDLVRLRNAGVPADYAVATKVEGRKPLSVDTLIRMRNRGLSAQEIRELRQ